MTVDRSTVQSQALTDQERLILKVLRLYYEHDLTQADIAARMGFSRPKVSKLISDGRDMGLVKIEVARPEDDLAPLEIALENGYGLTEAIVVPSSGAREATETSAGLAGAALLKRICNPTTALGLSWGVSLRALADAVSPGAFACGRVVPLVGGMGKAKARLHSSQVCATVAGKLRVESLDLAAPAIARSPQSRTELAALPGIHETLSVGKSCDVAVIGIGGILPDSTMVEAGYFSQEKFLSLGDQGIVGDVCCHFLDAEGEARYPDLSGRIVGVTPGDLRATPTKIGIATGREKAFGVSAAILGGYISSLICDGDLAVSLLDLLKRRKSSEPVG